jgi:hypothetical protein
VPRRFWRTPPDPGLGPQVEQRRRAWLARSPEERPRSARPEHRGGRGATSPPGRVQPACPWRNEGLMDARMLREPRTGLEAVMAASVIGDDEDVACGVISFHVRKPRDGAFRVVRVSPPGQLLAVAHPSCPVHPGFFGSSAVIHVRFDAMPIRRPAWGGIKDARHSWSAFLGTDGSLALRRLRVVGDDRRPFGTRVLVTRSPPTVGLPPAHSFLEPGYGASGCLRRGCRPLWRPAPVHPDGTSPTHSHLAPPSSRRVAQPCAQEVGGFARRR